MSITQLSTKSELFSNSISPEWSPLTFHSIRMHEDNVIDEEERNSADSMSFYVHYWRKRFGEPSSVALFHSSADQDAYRKRNAYKESDEDSDSDERIKLSLPHRRPELVLTNFLEKLVENPVGLDDFSTDTTSSNYEDEMMHKSQVKVNVYSTPSAFVDPIDKSHSTDLSTEENIKEDADIPEAESESDAFSSDDDLIFHSDDEMDLPTDSGAPNTMAKFESELQRMTFTSTKMKSSSLERIKIAKTQWLLKQITKEFLKKLIDDAVTTAEVLDVNSKYRAKLDKVRLVECMQKLLDEMNVEKYVNAFLNHKTMIYYRRKQQLTPIIEDSPSQVQTLETKYRAALFKLDRLLAREKRAKMTISDKVDNLQDQITYLEEEVKRGERKLENMVMQIFTLGKSENIKNSLRKQLDIMAQVRQNIAKLRLVLIQKMHTQASLSQQIEEVKVIGKDLHVDDYISLETQMIALGKKIEERELELNKIHSRLNYEMSLKAFFSEKMSIAIQVITELKASLQKHIERRTALRVELNKRKTMHNQMRRQIRDLTLRGGILSKPSLMLDYDATCDQCDMAQSRLQHLKWKRLKLRLSLKMAENKFATKTLNAV